MWESHDRTWSLVKSSAALGAKLFSWLACLDFIGSELIRRNFGLMIFEQPHQGPGQNFTPLSSLQIQNGDQKRKTVSKSVQDSTLDN